MNVAQRTLDIISGLLKTYGPSFIKKSLWEKEYLTDKWAFNDNTTGDCVYPYLEKYAKHGSILDLGCGSGNTANELVWSAYGSYLGVDISETALARARRWTERSGRTNKSKFAQGEILDYVPTQPFDVILFRESMYHVPLGKIKTVLDRYSMYLRDGGVFIVKMATLQNGKTKSKPGAMFRAIETEFEVLEKGQYGESGATVVVFRPRGCGKRGDASSRIAAQTA